MNTTSSSIIPAGLLSKWIHPRTGEVRLYINHPALRGRKVWIVELPAAVEMRGMYKILCEGREDDQVEETFDRLVLGLNPLTAVADDYPLWSELVAAAK